MDVTVLLPDGSLDTDYNRTATIGGVYRFEEGEQVPISATFKGGKLTLSEVHVDQSGEVTVFVEDGEIRSEVKLRSIPGIVSILPPLVAILLALTIRQVVISLFAGVWLGAVFIFDYNPFAGFLRVLDHFIVQALADPDHVAIVLFTLLFGGMVGVISKNGGTSGIASQLVKMANTPRRGQIATWLLGLVIFFDDYANTLIVGNTMRPITDKLRISREKLAYIVDSTAAPVSSIFFISTWIGFEIGLIDAAIKAIDYQVENAYSIFLSSIPYLFYPVFAILLVLVVALTGRDFGPMLHSERRARVHGKLYRDGAQLATDLTDSSSVRPLEGISKRWWNGAIPILTVVVVTIIGLYHTGYQNIIGSGSTDFSLGNIIGSANSYESLQWASLASCAVAIILSLSQRLLNIIQAMDAWFNGMKSMLLAMIILTLAWSIGAVTTELHTADYLVQLLKGNLLPQWLPVLTFLLAALVSFATGTSWGTMGILMPIVIPLAYALSVQAGLDSASLHTVILGSVSSVLAGAVFGDHCSPISDTTILSSMAAACDHIDHVRTQLPYAILAGLVGMLVGNIPTAFGLSPYISILFGTAVVVACIYLFGKKNEISGELMR
jgi:Na+/H+ antiporter NhaC